MIFREYHLRPDPKWKGTLPKNPQPSQLPSNTQDLILFLQQEEDILYFCQVSSTPEQATAAFCTYCGENDLLFAAFYATEITAASLEMLLRCADRIDHAGFFRPHGPLGYLPLFEAAGYEWVTEIESYPTDYVRLMHANRSRCPGLTAAVTAIHDNASKDACIYAVAGASMRTLQKRSDLLISAFRSRGKLSCGRVCVLQPLSMKTPVTTLCRLYPKLQDTSVLILLDRPESNHPLQDQILLFRLGALAEEYRQSVLTIFAVMPQADHLLDTVEQGLVSVPLTRLGWEQPTPPADAPPAPPAPAKEKQPLPAGEQPSSSSGAMSRMQKLVGLSEAKKIISQIVDYANAQKLYASRGFKHQKLGMHMVFSGSPGTCKTTFARLTAQILKEQGILSKGKLIEVGRSDLVGKYVGWTASQVKSLMKKAEGSVLFVDEAYALLDDRTGQFGDEALSTLVQEMENHRQDTVVILAGYKEPMKQLLERNPGLKSRISFEVPFPDYTAEELLRIFYLLLEENERRIRPQDEETIRELIRTEMQQPDFGNGRFIRNLTEHALMAQASRLMRLPPEQITDDDIRLLLPEDFSPQSPPIPWEELPGRNIGFRY